MSWAERAAERSPTVQRTRLRSIEQAGAIVAAARRLLAEDADGFTTQELAKEAGIALQTFYRYFASKDELVLAVIEEWIAEGAGLLADRAASLEHPLDRLRLYVTGSLEALADERALKMARYITAEHYRLHQLFPDELAQATHTFTALFATEIERAAAEGALAPVDISHDAWLVTQLAMAVFHHYAFATAIEPLEVVSDRLWGFTLAALGGASD